MEPLLDRSLFHAPAPKPRRRHSRGALTTVAALSAATLVSYGALYGIAFPDRTLAALRSATAAVSWDMQPPVERTFAAAGSGISALDTAAKRVYGALCPYIGTCGTDVPFAAQPQPTASRAPAAAAATSTPLAQAQPAYTPPPQHNIINQPVVERIIEREVAVVPSTAQFTTALRELEASFSERLALVAASIPSTQQFVSAPVFAQSQRIDNLSNVTITGATITGGSVEASSISGTIGNAIESALATITSLTATEVTFTRATTTDFIATNATTSALAVTGSATSTFTGGILASRLSASATSTLSGLVIDGNGLRFSTLDCSSFGNAGKLTTNASGNVVCGADEGGAGSTVGGANTQVQFNDAGSFAGSANFTFSSAASRLTVTNASTTAFTASYASSSVGHFGVLSLPSIAHELLSTNANGQVVATSSIGTNLLTGSLGTINNTTFNRGDSITITAASSTLLSDRNNWTSLNLFGNASTTLLSGTTAWFSTFIGNLTGNVTGNASTATALQTARNINGTAFDGTQDITITAASSTLLSSSNTWSALQRFSAGASTTRFSVFDTAYFGGTATSSFSSTGALTLAAPLAASSGGTGTSTPAAYGNVLAWNGSNWQGLATSSLAINTDNLVEGSTNLFWTNIRFDNRLSATTTLPNLTTLANLATVGTITSGIWNGSTIGVAYGGTGAASFGQGWVYSLGGTNALAASTSPTVSYLVATSTSQASILPYASTTAATVNGTAYFPGSGIWNSSGNVGIGTASPGKNLDVYSVSHPGVRIRDDTRTFDIFTAGGRFAIYDVTSASERLTVRSDGNIGIGGSGGDRALTIAVPAQNAVTTYGVRNVQTVQSDVTTSFNAYNTAPSTAVASFTLGNLRHYYAGQGTIGSGSSVTNQIGFYVDTSLTGATSNFGFRSDIAAASNRWNFYAGGTADNYFAGNVGIGTTTPRSLLHVVGTDLSSFTGTSNGLFTLQGTSGSSKYQAFDFNADSNGRLAPMARIASQNTGSGSYLFFGTSNSYASGITNTALTIDPTGNVGIGTTIPGNKLELDLTAAGTTQLAGSVANAAGSNNTKFNLGMVQDGSLTQFRAGMQTLGIWDGTHLDYETSFFTTDGGVASAERVRIDKSGNVGIGDTTPDARLDVEYGGSHELLVLNQTTPASYNVDMIWQDNGASRWLTSVRTASDDDFWFYNVGRSSVDLAIDAATGNVGIGTTTPWKKLSVTGAVGFDGLTGATGAGSLCLSANREVVYNSASDACQSSLRDTKHDISPLVVDALSQVLALQPVSFVYNEGDGRTRYGFIAEDTATVDAHLTTYSASGSLSGIDDRSILSIVVKAIQDLAGRIASILDRLSGHDTQLASHNAQIAALEAEVAALKAQAGAAPSGNSPTPQEGEPDTEPPVITINGNNPAVIHVGDTYNDLGATVTDNVDENLGYHTFLGSTLWEYAHLDTSEPNEWHIHYVASDSAGNTATSTRTVIVEAPPIIPPDETGDVPEQEDETPTS